MLALLSVSLVALFTEYAQAQVRFARTYGGTSWDYASSVQQTSDGGYILAGGTRSFGAGWYDVFLIKTNAFGNVQWAKTYRIYSGDDHYALFVQQTSDGGYIVAGEVETYDPNWFVWGSKSILLIKTDAFGNVQWAKMYGGGSTVYEDLCCIQQTSDGGYIFASKTRIASTSDDIFLIKTDANGNVQWAKAFGGTVNAWASSVRQTSDGGYIVAGTTWSFGAGWGDIFLIKTDANGNVQWAKTYGGTNEDVAPSVQQTSDGGYIVAGYTTSFGAGWGDIFLIKTDANGDIGSCGIVRNVTPMVTTPSPTVTAPSLSVYPPFFPFGSASPAVTSPTLTVNAPCPLSDDNELGISESCKPISGIITPYKGGIKITKSGEFEVKVYNVSGVMVKSVKGKNEVKLELPRGVYFVEVVSGGKVIRERVVIR